MCCFFFFKQKTAYEMRISDWSSDVCSSDLVGAGRPEVDCAVHAEPVGAAAAQCVLEGSGSSLSFVGEEPLDGKGLRRGPGRLPEAPSRGACDLLQAGERSEEHTSQLQSLMRISYAVFCLKKKKQKYKQ